MKENNIFANLPVNLGEEVFETIFSHAGLRVERIVSFGQSSPDDFWYDQEEHEWVMVLEGEAILEFEEKKVNLKKGDFLNIPAHTKHRVAWTKEDEATIWLCLFYQ